MEGQKDRSAQLSWTWIVLAGLLILLTSYIWIIYDPTWLVVGSMLAALGVIVSATGLAWRPHIT